MKSLRKDKKVPGNWWRNFFDSVVGEILFVPSGEVTDKETATIIKATMARPPAHVLDLACGIGRHSIAFAGRGFAVSGLDYSASYIREARKHARNAKLPVAFVRGDMRNLRKHFEPKRFDLVVSLFNSFGYFAKRSDDRLVLKEVFRVLKPGGALVINTLNGDGVAARLKTPLSTGREPLPHVFMIDAARYDKLNRQTLSQWTIIDTRRPRARVMRNSFRQNVYSHAELKRMLRAAGFRIERVWGMLSGRRFDPAKSWHQTIVARRPGRRKRG